MRARFRERGGGLVTGSLRPIAVPFVAARPGGARVRARLRLSPGDEAVLRTLGVHLGSRGSLARGGLTEAQWRERWESARMFLTADGEKDKAWGNETIRWHPDGGWLEIKLPAPLAHLANQPHGRYRLSAPVAFRYRGDEVAAQETSGAVRYDIHRDVVRGRWHIDASWKAAPAREPSLDDLRASPMVAIDVNHGHLAAALIAPDGNVLGAPATIGLNLAGLPSATRDGHLRAAISALIATAKASNARAIVIEDLDFAEARAEGRERTGSRPSRGRRGRDFRRAVSGIPTGKFRGRLVHRKPAAPRDPRQPPGVKTRRPHGTTAGNQAAQDRSGPPTRQDNVLLVQQERLIL